MARVGRLSVLVAGLAASAAAAFGGQPSPATTGRRPPGIVPGGVRAAVGQAIEAAEAATSLEEIARARQLVDRLEERQRRSGSSWLLAAEEIPPAGSGDPRAAGTLLPLERLTAQLRRHLAAGLSRLLHEEAVVSAAVSDAAAHRDTARLQELARTSSSGLVVCQALLAAGDLALERGWPSAAAEAWRQAEHTARLMDRPRLIEAVRRRQDASGTIPGMERPSSAASSGVDVAVPPATQSPRVSLALRWQHPLPKRDAAISAIRPRVTSTADGTAPLICWHAQGGIHARQLADGAVPWSRSSTGPVADRLFPPVGDSTIPPAWPPYVQGGRLLSLAETPSSRMLICLDLSDAAEGRLLWTARLTEQAGGDGAAPVCSLDGRGEALAFVGVRGAETELMAIRLADGQLLWRRPLGGLWHHAAAPRPPAAAVAEDLVIAVADDGSVWAMDQAGSLVWAREPATANDNPTAIAAALPVQAPVVNRGTVVTCSSDGRQLTALGVRSGEIRWQFAAPTRLSVVGIAGGVLVAFHDDRIVSLSLSDGSLLASRPTPGPPLVGEPLLADSWLFWPVASQRTPADGRPSTPAASAGGQVLMLAPATLDDAAAPLALGSPPAGSVSLAAGDGRLVVCDDASIRVFGITAAD